jgi:hypothetical protein
MNRFHWFVLLLVFSLVVGLSFTKPALAASLHHEAPEGSEWIMADWMFLSFVLFAGTAFVAFIMALKAGLLSNLEDAKYYILEIEEEDDYSTSKTFLDGGGR